MSSQKSSATTETFLDRWGHWVLWMGPFIAVVSILAWTPRLIWLMAGIELVQFVVHVSCRHPEHPMAGSLSFFMAGVVLIIGVALIPSTRVMWLGVVWLLLLVSLQIVFSSAVHKWNHGDMGAFVHRGAYLISLVSYPILSVVVVVWGIVVGNVLGFPLLRVFLL